MAVYLHAPQFLQMVVESPLIPGAEPGSDANWWKSHRYGTHSQLTESRKILAQQLLLF
jgi:hypothetical protein